MDKHAVKEIQKEYNGTKYIFPLAVKAENIENPEQMTITFSSVEAGNNLPQSNTKLGAFLAKVVAWLSKLKNELDEKAGLKATKHTTVTEFDHGITGSVSIIKYGYNVLVTAAISTPIVITDETVLFEDNSIITAFGIPVHDFHCALAYSVDGVMDGGVGMMSMKPDTGLRVSLPKIGQYYGCFTYCVREE